MTRRAVLITGAGRGIGRAIALAFSTPATTVVLTGRTASDLSNVATEVSAAGAEPIVLPVDVTDPQSVEQMAEALRGRGCRVDVLVNNAGSGGGEPVQGSEIARWRRTIDTNLIGTYLITRAALPFMNNDGRIINMSSVLGRFGVPGYTAYCAAKHAIIGFTRALALELVPRHITVNALCPGWVDTDMAEQGMTQGAAALGITFEEFRAQAIGAVPIGRIIRPDEVARLAVFLADPASSAITGQTYNICGGQVMS